MLPLPIQQVQAPYKGGLLSCRSRTTAEPEGPWTLPTLGLPTHSILAPTPECLSCPCHDRSRAAGKTQGLFIRVDMVLPPTGWKIRLSILPFLWSPIRLIPQQVLLYLCPSPNSYVEIPAPKGDDIRRRGLWKAVTS